MSEFLPENISKLRVVELREILKKYNLKAGGKKSELVARLSKYLKNLHNDNEKSENTPDRNSEKDEQSGSDEEFLIDENPVNIEKLISPNEIKTLKIPSDDDQQEEIKISVDVDVDNQKAEINQTTESIDKTANNNKISPKMPTGQVKRSGDLKESLDEFSNDISNDIGVSNEKYVDSNVPEFEHRVKHSADQQNIKTILQEPSDDKSTFSKQRRSSPSDSEIIKNTDDIDNENDSEMYIKRQKLSETDDSGHKDSNIRDISGESYDPMATSLKITIGNDQTEGSGSQEDLDKQRNIPRVVRSTKIETDIPTRNKSSETTFSIYIPEYNETIHRDLNLKQNDKQTSLAETLLDDNLKKISVHESPQDELKEQSIEYNQKEIHHKVPIITEALSDRMIDSDETDDETQEEVSVPICKNPKSPSLRINGFVRPLRDDDVKKMLSKFGFVEKFMMNDIKSYCFVTFPSEEASEKCRDSI